jgi:glycosyltransferase involved in cell wall biosynthesis
MIRVAGFTQGKHVPSARFRVRQYRDGLREQGIELREFPASWGAYPPASSALRPGWGIASVASRIPAILRSFDADVTLLQREMVSSLATLEGWTHAPRVLDVDDAIFLLKGGSAARRLSRLCDSVICGNQYLADHFSAWNSNVVVIPTAVDTERFRPAHRAAREEIVIGWSGSSNAFGDLERIQPALAAVLRKHPQTRFVAMANQRPRLPELPDGRFEFVPWSEGAEVATLQGFDVGLMPLEDTEWNRGKCSYKLLLYMACGTAAVVSPVGMNQDVLRLGKVALPAAQAEDWFSALDRLVTDPGERGAMGMTARAAAVQHYGLGAVVPRLADHLRRAAKPSKR